MTASAQPQFAFRLATAPARWLGRYRPDLAATLRADALTYAGPRASLFLLLLAIGLGYTLAVQAIHAFVGYVPTEVNPFDYVYRPFFTRLFAESLLYMATVAGVGAFSPALGVLVVIVFIPTDLAAAAVATVPQFSPQPAALAARLITYALLWVLAVEIPVLVRRFEGPSGTTLRAVAWRAGATAVLVAMWANLVPWLIRPAMVWTSLLQVQDDISAPLWQFWPFLAVAAALTAGLAAVVSRQAGSTGFSPEPASRAPNPARSTRRDWISVAVLAVLFAGFYDGVLETILILAALIITLPVLSSALPRIPVPGPLRGGSIVVRFALAIVVTAVIGWAFTTVGSGMVNINATLAGPILVFITAPLFRLIVELGWRAPTRPTTPAATSAAITASLTLLGFGLLWIALPALALAGDCPDDTGWYCLAKFAAGAPLLAAAVGAALAAAALNKAWDDWNAPPPPPPPDSGLPSFEQQQEDKGGFFRGPSDSFKNIEKGTGDFFDK